MRSSQGSLGSNKYSLKYLHVLRLTDVMHPCSFARARCLLIALIIPSALKDIIMVFWSGSSSRYLLAFPLA